VLIFGLASLLVAGFTSFCQPAASQEQTSGQESALGLEVANITAEPGQTVPINISVIGVPENLYGFILIQGIPSRFELSSGFVNGGDWLVSLSELKDLRLAVPDDFDGRFDIEVTLVLQGSEQRQTRSASIAIQQPPPLQGPFQLEPVELPPVIPPEPDNSITEAAKDLLTGDETDAAGTGTPPFSTDIEQQPQTNPNNAPPPDEAPTEQDVAAFCDGQRRICGKVCDLRSRNDFTGCPQRCESRVARCNKTGCYKWTEPELIIAGSFGGQKCLQ
jgi:hypothetical protein